MKLSFVIHSLGPGGAERVTAMLANHWASQGWEVSLVTLTDQSADAYAVDPRVQRIGLREAGESGGLARALWSNWRRVRRLGVVLRRLRPDAVVGMMTTSSVLLALARRQLRGIRLIGSERTYPPQLPLGAIWETLRARTYGRLDVVVAQTAKVGSWLEQHTRAGRIVVIPNPVEFPLPAHSPLQSPDSAGVPGRRRVLSVGRLGEEKQFGGLIAAFASLAPSHPDWELVILGEGSERRALEEQVADLKLEDRVYLPGRAGNVGGWYAAADLFVLCSRFEGFPNALMEAMAYGLPAISFDCDCGPSDIIRPGVDGMLVPPGDWPGLGRALSQLMEDAALRQSYGAAATEVRTRFDLATVAARWEALFGAGAR